LATHCNSARHKQNAAAHEGVGARLAHVGSSAAAAAAAVGVVAAAAPAAHSPDLVQSSLQQRSAAHKAALTDVVQHLSAQCVPLYSFDRLLTSEFVALLDRLPRPFVGGKQLRVQYLPLAVLRRVAL
jgi:hypothetical protein